MFRNVAGIEIQELKDSLAYAEYMLSKNMQDKEQLMKENQDHAIEMRKANSKLDEVT